MAQIPILSGIYADQRGDFRTSYPRNMVPVPKATGIADGYLRPADGVVQFATGPGVDRGGYEWRGTLYRVMGSKLVSVSRAGAATVLGDVGIGGPVTMDAGFDVLAIWSAGGLYYWTGSELQRVTDPDLGQVIDGVWVAGYYLSTDGEFLIVTELNDRTQVNPLKYGSAEADPDTVKAVDEYRNEVYAFGRYTIEVFENVGGTGFPFQRIEGAQVPRGIIGTHTYTLFGDGFAFIGSARNEAPAIYISSGGAAVEISTREIELVLQRYTEEQLAQSVLETRHDGGHEWLMVHLPDTCWVYDLAATKQLQTPVWFELNSAIVGYATYRAKHHVWCYDRWIVGDPTGPRLGAMTDTTATHYGSTVGWEFATAMLYNEGRGAVIHRLELVGLPGRVALGADPVVWTSYSLDGETWSAERTAQAGKLGQRDKRICWRRQGSMRQYRMQRFRGTSAARLSISRLEAEIEALNV